MKHIIRFLMLSILGFMVTSCAMHTGYMNNSASLAEANFSYAEQSISGFSETYHVFGIGGLEKEALVEEAKKDMLKNHPLQANQALANVTVNWKNSFYIIIMMSKCTVTADIVEFK